MSRTMKLVALAFALALPAKSYAQMNLRKEARAVRLDPGVPAPHVDGRLDDPAWTGAQFIADFIAKEPVEGAAPLAGTRLAIVYDEDALYVGARMESARPSDVPVLLTRRDAFGTSEVLLVAFDTYLDRRTAYTFGVTAAGTRLDFYQPADSELSRDWGYDPVWEAKTSVDSAGWTAEFRIPFSQLRYPERSEHTWGMNINRYIPTRNEDLFWIMVPKNETGWSSRFGNLVGISGVRPSRRLEVVPYGASSATLTGSRDPSNTFDDGRNLAARMGADLKMGLGPSLTIDATVNPDFGQVEADPAEVNLTAFPTFFTEKRPFFAEGADLLQMAGFFYSRRIGAPPHGAAAGTFLDRPPYSTILGAAKLSGRLSPSLSIAALTAVTDREFARTYDLASRTLGRTRIEPVTSHTVTRLVKKFGASGSTAGALLTTTHRDMGPSDPLARILTHDAVTGGANGVFRFSGGKYAISWMAGLSHVRGDTAALRSIQQASAHFLQSPDVHVGGFNPLRTTMTGFTWSYRVEKLGGKHWLWDVWGETESPTFELNDLGRLNSGNDIDNYLDIKYRENRPSRTVYNYSIGFSTRAGFNFDGVRQMAYASINPAITWINYLYTWGQLAVNFASTSDALTRGGPLMGTPRTLTATLGFNTNQRQATNWTGQLDLRDDDLGGWGYTIKGGFNARPNGRWSFSATPSYARSVEARQYLTTVAGGPAATYGKRYVFSFIDRGTLSSQFRLSYLMGPDLNLELYAEPFAATGRYYGVGELVASRSRDLRVYGSAPGTAASRAGNGDYTFTDGTASFSLLNPDFSIVSFRSNLVLRWEWRPGSTLFLVWQQSRAGSRAAGDLVTPGRLFDSFTAPGNNFLAVKIAYWLPVL